MAMRAFGHFIGRLHMLFVCALVALIHLFERGKLPIQFREFFFHCRQTDFGFIDKAVIAGRFKLLDITLKIDIVHF